MIRSIGSTWLLTAATVLATYVLMPFTIRTLGDDAYGTWQIVTSLTGYLGLLSLGVPMAAVREFARRTGDADPRPLNVAIASVTGLFLALGALALLAGLALLAVFRGAYDVPEALRGPATAAFLLLTTQAAAGFLAQIPVGLLAATQDFPARNAVALGALVLRVALTLVALRTAPDLRTLALVQLATLVVESAGHVAILHRRHPGLRLELSLADRDVVREVFGFSAWVLLLSLGAQLSFMSDALVIGRRLGAEQVPFYSVGNALVVQLMQFVLGIAAVVMPAAARLTAAGDAAALRTLLRRWGKVATLLTGAAAAFLLVHGPGFIGWWVGPRYAESNGRVLQLLLVSGLVFLPVRGVMLPLLMGMGEARRPTVAFALAGVANLTLSYALAPRWGLTGVALGTAIPNVLVGLYIGGVALRALALPVGATIRHVFGIPLLAMLPVGGAVWAAAQAVEAPPLAELLLGGGVWVATALPMALLAYRGDGDVDLTALLRRLLPRGSAG